MLGENIIIFSCIINRFYEKHSLWRIQEKLFTMFNKRCSKTFCPWFSYSNSGTRKTFEDVLDVVSHWGTLKSQHECVSWILLWLFCFCFIIFFSYSLWSCLMWTPFGLVLGAIEDTVNSTPSYGFILTQKVRYVQHK